MKHREVWIGVAVAIGLAAYGFVRCHETPHPQAVTLVDRDSELRGPSEPPAETTGDPARPETQRDGESATPALDRRRREEMRQAIYRAWGLSAPTDDYRGSAPPPQPSAVAESRPFDKDYIRSRIREDYIPLAKDCYEKGLKKNPKLEGKLTASFRIVGNKNVGGIIDWVDTSKDTTLADKDVVDCLEQSLYSVSFQAPPNDGVITVTYPLTFAPDPPDGGSD